MEFSKISKSAHKKNARWNVDLTFILTFYDCYVREPSLNITAAALGIRAPNLRVLIDKHPELAQAKEMAEQNRNKGMLGNYVLTNLTKASKEIWDRLTKVNTHEAIESIFKGKPIKLRQELFCHAILHTGYDISKACNIVGVDRYQMESWKQDLGFLQMLEEVQFHKKNFFEKALIGLVAEGYPGAIIHANRTVNADRGYREGIDVNINGTPGRVDWEIGDLDLDVETMKKVLAAIEKKKQASMEEDLAQEREWRSTKKLPPTNGG
jgi:hypothetical protein